MAYDEDLEKGIRNLEEILYRLDDRARNVEWLKEHAPAQAPDRIKEAIVKSFPQPVVPPPAETPVSAPSPVPVPPPAAAPKAVEPRPEARAPAPVRPPERKPAEPPVKKPEPAPDVKPAKRSFVVNKTAVILFCAGLALAGGVYRLTLNSAKSRYAQAGKLVKSARNAEAISAYSKIITLYPRSTEAAYSQYAIADIKAALGDLPTAIEHYERYLVAAPDKDPKIASARFKIAELQLKEDRLADAQYLYQNAAIQASEYAGRAADRLKQIGAVNARLADAKKLLAKAPDKAVRAYAAVVAAHPRYAAALSGLQEARKALVAANSRPVKKRAPAPRPKPARPAPVKSAPEPATPGPAPEQTPAAAAAALKLQFEMCEAVWLAGQAQGRLSADMMFTKVRFNCDELKQKLDACREAREEVMALQGVPPEARVRMTLELDPDWTLARQLEQDERIRKNYEDRRCGDLLKAVPY